MSPTQQFFLILFYALSGKGWYFPTPSWRDENLEQLINKLHMPWLHIKACHLQSNIFLREGHSWGVLSPTHMLIASQGTHLITALAGVPPVCRKKAGTQMEELIKGISKGTEWAPLKALHNILAAEGIFVEELKQNQTFCSSFSSQIQTAEIFWGEKSTASNSAVTQT